MIQHNKKASLWHWKAPKTLKTHARPCLLFLLNMPNAICPSIFTVTHDPQIFLVYVFSYSCPLIFFPYFICSIFSWCPLLSEDLLFPPWMGAHIKWAGHRKCQANTSLLGFQTQWGAAVKSLPSPNTGEQSNGITHNVWGLHVHDLQLVRPGWF